MKDDPVRIFRDLVQWETWLATHHDEEGGIWLKIAKKGSKKRSLSYADAVEGALCFGWIDGQARSLDDDFYLQRFTRRRAKSPWSRINREKVEALIAAGRVQEPGLRAVEAAKADGRLDSAYEPPSKAAVPPDLAAALKAAPKARRFFDSLNSRNRFAVIHRIATARTPETRTRRIEKYVAMFEEGRRIYE
jgi:uncharacterized protein YdeI (YjbR/CyaY-like superfamily)